MYVKMQCNASHCPKNTNHRPKNVRHKYIIGHYSYHSVRIIDIVPVLVQVRYCWQFATYIHNWSLQSFRQDYWPSFSHHLCCVLILYISDGTYSLKSIPNDKFFEKLFMAILFTLKVFATNLLRVNRRRNTFCILFWCLAWTWAGFSSNKPTHYLLDYGDYKM